MKVLALLLSLLAISAAQAPPPLPPPDVPHDIRDLFRDVAEALVNQDASAFLSKFDAKMQGYDTLRDEVESLLDHAAVPSDIEFVSDKTEDGKRELQIDWLLEIPNQRARRQIVTCTIAREGKKWKITSLAPIDFFKE